MGALLNQRQHHIDGGGGYANEATHLLDRRDERVDLHGAAPLQVLQHGSAVRTNCSGATDALLDVHREAHPQLLAPMACASDIMARATVRVPDSLATTSRVSPVRALIGLKQRFPQSFTQISLRMRRIGALRPPAINASASA